MNQAEIRGYAAAEAVVSMQDYAETLEETNPGAFLGKLGAETLKAICPGWKYGWPQ